MSRRSSQIDVGFNQKSASSTNICSTSRNTYRSGTFVRDGKKTRDCGIEVFPGIAEKLPFLPQQFDYALMVTTICFIDVIEQSFKEAWRVLKPNGIIIIGFVDSESKIGQTYLKRKHESVFYQDATFYSTKEVLEHLQNAGFKESSTIQTLFPEPTLDAIKSGFGEGSFVVITSHK
ncbi:class I SAM-dependent methyltransferase [uncultured Sphaerochaeta sp.]|uniref:class I SAM-dependent methyltransferase n=1 Tax=uncultured Sphaerochaeta sp. TaxID=886478 RepID=UPI0029CA152A|nr:class I SAM-dependent methyltransferase [uncultured Sphaerochaeta sp.]